MSEQRQGSSQGEHAHGGDNPLTSAHIEQSELVTAPTQGPSGGGGAGAAVVASAAAGGRWAKGGKVPAYFESFKSLEQIFTFFSGRDGEDEERLGQLAALMIKDYKALQDTFLRWEQASCDHDGNRNDSDALKAAVRRGAKKQSGKDASRRLFKVVQNRPEVASIVSGAFMLLEGGAWSEMPGGHKDSYAWNLLWTWSKPKINWSQLHIWQRVNHFPESKQLCRKDNLKRHVQRFSNIPGKLGHFFDILPVCSTEACGCGFGNRTVFGVFGVGLATEQLVCAWQQKSVWCVFGVGLATAS